MPPVMYLLPSGRGLSGSAARHPLLLFRRVPQAFPTPRRGLYAVSVRHREILRKLNPQGVNGIDLSSERPKI